jgi:hypothetical protein
MATAEMNAVQLVAHADEGVVSWNGSGHTEEAPKVKALQALKALGRFAIGLPEDPSAVVTITETDAELLASRP